MSNFIAKTYICINYQENNTFLLLLFLISNQIIAQVTFQEMIITNDSTIDAPRSVYLVDMDGDGDIDILTSSMDDDKVVWFKNSLIISVVENEETNFAVFPNPTSNILYMQEVIEQVQVFDNLGKIMLEKSHTNQIDLKVLRKGIYIIKLISIDKKKRIIKVIKS